MHTTTPPRRHLIAAARLWAVAIVCAAPACATSSSVVSWSGTLVDDPLLIGAFEPLPTATISAWSTGGQQIDAGEPIPDQPGDAGLLVQPGIDLALRVEAPGYTPTVWPTRSPSGAAVWLDGALYPRSVDVLAALRDEFLPDAGLPADGETSGLWIEPDPAAPWADPPLTIEGQSTGDPGDIESQVGLRIREDGVWVPAEDNLPDIILVFDLAPGSTEVILRSATGADRALPLSLRPGELGMLPRLRPVED